MASELSPPGGKPKMTQAQVRKYIQNMKKAQEIAKAKIKASQEDNERKEEAEELQEIEKHLKDL